MPISSRDGIVREPTVGITSLSELNIDVDKDWLGRVIKNLGAPSATGDAVRLPVLRANMEYPTEDVTFAYLAAIGKLVVSAWEGSYACFALTVDGFADKALMYGGVTSTVDFGYGGCSIARFASWGNLYKVQTSVAAAAADFQIIRMSAGADTVIGSEAVDLGTSVAYTFKFSLIGSTLKAFRADMTTPKITVTDTAYASGPFGTGPIRENASNPLIVAKLLAPSSPSSKPVAYFEVPVVGTGTLEDPFRARMPEEIAWEWSLNPEAKKKHDLLVAKGFTDEEIATLFPEVLSCRTNRLALTQSSLIKTDRATGKPVEYTAVVRVFEQPDRQAHLRPVLDALTALRGMAGVRELTREEAIRRAKQIDPDLTDVDLIRISPTDPNFKTVLKDYIRHREALGVKRELIDDKLMERYLTETKGW